MTMMIAGPRDNAGLAASTIAGVQTQLATLIGDRRGTVTWWVEIARELDCLADFVCSAPGDLIDPEGFTEQLRADAPHLMARWTRLCTEGEALAAQVGHVRLLVGAHAADPNAVPMITSEIRELLTRTRRFQQRTTDVMLDAYERDLGGE